MKKQCIINKKARAILLPIQHFNEIQQVIPLAKRVNYKGKDIVLIKHRELETNLLNRIGFNVPTPFEVYYQWPKIKGEYDPFSHQEVSAGFLTLHHKCFLLNDLGCVDSETEYLTPTGWKRIDQYSSGFVGQYNPETGSLEFVEPQAYIKKPCEEMYHLHTKYGVDQMLSSEHRVLLQATLNPDKSEVVTADELFERQEQWFNGEKPKKSLERINWRQAGIPTSFNYAGGGGIELSDENLRLQIAVIADGYFDSKSTTNRCVIRLKKDRKKIRLRRLLKDSGVYYVEKTPEYKNAKGFSVFTFKAPLRLKHFDKRFWEASAQQLKLIADEVLHWDGSINLTKKSDSFHTRNKDSADFVQFVFNSQGINTSLNTYVHKKDGKLDYCVTVKYSDASYGLKSTGTDKERYRTMVKVPSTDGYKYCFSVPSSFLILRRNGRIFITGNSGKTETMLAAYDYLKSIGNAKKALFVAPLSCLEPVWVNALFETFHNLTYTVLHGSAAKRKERLKHDVDVYIINHDGVKVVQEDLAKRDDIDLIAVDEASVLCNSQTNMWKAYNALNTPERRLWLATGTPASKAPTDAWALAKLVSPNNIPKYFGTFKRQTMIQISQFKWVPMPDSFQKVYEVLQPGIRFKKEDCLDLPPVTWENRECELSAEQNKYLKEMRNEMVMEHNGTEITAVNAADKMGKIRQILCGAIRTEDGEYVTLDFKPRLKVLEECIDSARAKVAIICPYKGITRVLYQMLKKKHSCAMINGDVPKSKRNEIVMKFQKEKDPRILIAHPKTVSHGLTLTEADVLIFYGPIDSSELYIQAANRLDRPGQKRNVTIINLAGHSIEKLMYKGLKEKKGLQNQALNLFKTFIES